jgi:two-component system response regulator HydG
LNVIHVNIPPLRERPFDIPLLIEHFIGALAQRSGHSSLDVSPEALAILTAYSWPGNVRELENVLERAAALTDTAVLTDADLPDRVRGNGRTVSLLSRARENRMTLAELEKEYIVETLRLTGGNKSRAASILGFDRRTLHRKLDEYRAADPNFEL